MRLRKSVVIARANLLAETYVFTGILAAEKTCDARTCLRISGQQRRIPLNDRQPVLPVRPRRMCAEHRAVAVPSRQTGEVSKRRNMLRDKICRWGL